MPQKFNTLKVDPYLLNNYFDHVILLIILVVFGMILKFIHKKIMLNQNKNQQIQEENSLSMKIF